MQELQGAAGAVKFRVVLLLLLAASAARADRRSFVRSYEYATQPQGNLELELWNDIEAPRDRGFDAAFTVHKVELEYGLTDHWDLALYHVFAQEAGAFKFDSWRAETRYRFAEKGEWPVDLLLYFEVERPAAFAEPWETEEKIILAKDFGPLFRALLRNESRMLIYDIGREGCIKLLSVNFLGNFFDFALLSFAFLGVVFGVTLGGEISAESHRDRTSRDLS